MQICCLKFNSKHFSKKKTFYFEVKESQIVKKYFPFAEVIKALLGDFDKCLILSMKL